VAADPLQIRIAHLEGSYEQIDKRMGALEGHMRDMNVEISATRTDLRSEISGARTELFAEIRRVGARIDTVLYGVVVAILVPIFLRVFFH
jgi:hypothetical protein